MLTAILTSTILKYALVGFAGGLLAVVVKRTFGANNFVGPIGTLALLGFFAYGVMYKQDWAFFGAFAAFWFACVTTIYE